MQEYTLKKRHPGCTGMFWRSDPAGTTTVASNKNWPRDGAQLRGTPTEYKGTKWLAVTHVKQAPSSNWTPKWLAVKKAPSSDWIPAPDGAYIPFEYDNHYYLE